MATGAVIVRILSQYSEKGSKAAKKDIDRLGKQFDKFSTKITKAYAIATAAAGAFAIKIGKDSVKAAIADQKSQAILANTIQNVLGGTKEQIAVIEDYISKTEMLTAVQDDELRPSLGKLISVTKDASLAMYLNNIALDLAAKAGVDVGTATDAITKALRGQFKGLQSLGIGLDATTVKTKNIGKAFEITASQTKGAAEAAADADPYARLATQFDNLKKSIGYALLPVVTQFSEYLIKVLLPSLQTWISLHQNEIQTALITTANAMTSLIQGMVKLDSFLRKIHISLVSFSAAIIAIINIAKLSIVIGQFVGWFIAITKARAEMQLLAATTASTIPIIETAGVVATSASAGFTAIGVTSAGATAGLGAFLTKMGMGGNAVKWIIGIINPLKKVAIALAVVYAASALLEKLWKKLFGGSSNLVTDLDRKYIRPSSDSAQTARKEFESWTKATEDANKEREQALKLSKLTAASDAKALKDAKAAALRAAIQKKIQSKFGIKFSPTGEEYDAIQDKAVLMNLKRSKEGAAYLAEMNKLTQINNDLEKDRIINLMKQADIVQYLDKLRQNDLVVLGYLAKKWDMTTEAADAYIKSVLAISDNKVDDYEVILLAKAWGSTQEQARMYLDFFQALNDGVLSDAEIAKLQARWGMTQKEVLQYADFVRVVNDGKLTDEEIKKLQDRWGLTVQEISDYIFKLGAPVTYTGTLIDPAIFAKNAWLDAIAALERYIKMLGGVPGGVPGGKGFIPGSGEDPAVIAAAAAASAAAADAAADAAAALAESEEALKELEEAGKRAAARSYAIAKATGDMDSAAFFAAQVGPSVNAAGESGAIGAASIAAQLKAAEQALANERIMTTYASFKAKEAADAAASISAYANSQAADDAERARFRALTQGTVNTASGLSGGGNLIAGGGNINVTVNVSGSVTAEQDLVQSVRNGLLAAQYNGNQINLQAV